MEITKIAKTGYFVSFKSVDAAINTDSPKADLVLYTKKQSGEIKSLTFFDSAGEYEVKNCMVDAVALSEDNTAYSMLADDIRVTYVGQVTEPLSDEQIEQFAATDILFIPIVGEKASLTTQIVNQIEPKVIVTYTDKPEELAVFEKEFGSDVERTVKYKITKKDLSETEQQNLVVFE